MKIKTIYFILFTMVISMTLNGCTQVSGKEESSDSASRQAGAAPITSSDGMITFSHIGGLYESAFDLELTSSNGGMIRYTLDGSDPTSQSDIYENPVKIYDRTSEENTLSAIITEGKLSDFMGNHNQEGRQPQDFQEESGENEPEQAPENREKSSDENQDRSKEISENWKNQRPDGAMGRGEEGFGGSKAVAPAENVFKGNVIKASVFSESGEQISEIMVQSYFVSEDILTRYHLPVVSIVTDEENFYDEEKGLYTNSDESGAEWERPVHFELYASDGTPAVSQNMGVRLSGNSTRSYQQKSMRFYAKAEYDENHKSVEYELFEGLTKSYSDEVLSTFKRVLLRNSGNDNSSTMMRDSLMQDLASDLNLDTQASQPCVAFVNGEFWGIYNIRERYDDQYFSNHYDIPKADVAVLEIANSSITPEVNEGDEKDLADYQEMWNFFNENSMTEEENYKKALEYIDIDNFIDYFIVNIYSGNTDWPANNNVFWRYKTESEGYDSSAVWYMDGRYRWVLKDMDFGFGLMGQVSDNTLEHAASEEESKGGFQRGRGKGEGVPDAGMSQRGEGGQGRTMGFTSASSTLIFRKLLENEQFRDQFINRFCDLMNTNYETDYVLNKIEEYKSDRETAMPEQINRYSSAISSMEEWEENIDKMRSFIKERTTYVQGFLKERFSLGDKVTITLLFDSETGYIQINDKKIKSDISRVSDSEPWNGDYFAGTTQTFTAVPLEGHTFSHFIVTDTESGTFAEYKTEQIQVILGNHETVIEAVFE